MDKNDAIKIITRYGAVVKSDTGTKVTATCPFAQHTHSGGSDRTPSFAVFQAMYGWRYKCMACGESGSMRKMFWRKHEFTGRYDLIVNQLVYADALDPDKKPEIESLDYRVGGPELGDAVLHHKPIHKGPDGASVVDWCAGPRTGEQVLMEGVGASTKPVEIPLPVEMIERFVAEKNVPEYIFDLGFQDAHDAWGLGVDWKTRRWILPVRDVGGEIVGYTGRLFWEDGHCFRCGTGIRRPGNAKKNVSNCPKCRQSYVKYKHHPGQWRREAVFGAHMMKKDGPVLILEGPTDVLRMWCYGFRSAVAILGASPSPGQIDLIASMSKDVIVMGDGDAAGRMMNDEVSFMFQRRGIKAEVVTLTKGDPGDMGFAQAKKLLPERLFQGR